MTDLEVSSSSCCGFSWFYYAQTTASDVYIPCIHLSMQDTSSIYLHALYTPTTAINSQYRCSDGVPTVREYVQSLLICTVSQVAKSRNMQSLAICKFIYNAVQSAKSLKLRSCLGWRCGASCLVARCDFFDVEQDIYCALPFFANEKGHFRVAFLHVPLFGTACAEVFQD